MIINERTSRHENVIAAARQLLIAARTAPKARGVDIIEVALIEGWTIAFVANLDHAVG